MQVKLYAAPDIEFTGDEINKNIKVKIQQLIRASKNKGKEHPEEEVYACYKLNLCKRCGIFRINV
ncbi:MAG: hypothetical protein ABIC18_05395 [Candidatus Omnitrophota bacterium]